MTLSSRRISVIMTQRRLTHKRLILLTHINMLHPTHNTSRTRILKSNLIVTPNILDKRISVGTIIPIVLRQARTRTTANRLNSGLLSRHNLTQILMTSGHSHKSNQYQDYKHSNSKYTHKYITHNSRNLGNDNLAFYAVPRTQTTTLLIRRTRISSLRTTVSNLTRIMSNRAHNAHTNRNLRLSAHLTHRTNHGRCIGTGLPIHTHQHPTLKRILDQHPHHDSKHGITLTLNGRRQVTRKSSITHIFSNRSTHRTHTNGRITLFNTILRRRNLYLKIRRSNTLNGNSTVNLNLIKRISRTCLTLNIRVHRLITANIANKLNYDTNEQLYKHINITDVHHDHSFINERHNPTDNHNNVNMPTLNRVVVLQFKAWVITYPRLSHIPTIYKPQRHTGSGMPTCRRRNTKHHTPGAQRHWANASTHFHQPSNTSNYGSRGGN